MSLHYVAKLKSSAFVEKNSSNEYYKLTNFGYFSDSRLTTTTVARVIVLLKIKINFN